MYLNKDIQDSLKYICIVFCITNVRNDKKNLQWGNIYEY